MKTLLLLALVLVVFGLAVRRADKCAQFESFDSWGNLEDFVWSFPESKQAHVRYCLDKLAKRRGLQ